MFYIANFIPYYRCKKMFRKYSDGVITTESDTGDIEVWNNFFDGELAESHAFFDHGTGKAVQVFDDQVYYI